ncbi:MAG: hypothetical protein MGG11_22275 [Trichodesmium sp. MAG_R03]|nr:hypothetical protein [Trichodesmium sp. MAG_R03]
MEDIRIFGPRPSGKLVYLTTLACWPNPSPNSPVLSVEPLEYKALDLIEMGRDILQNGYLLPPMCDPVSCGLSITLKQSFNILNPFVRRVITLNANYTAYPGEYFEDILMLDHEGFTDFLEYVFDDLAKANQFILMFDSTTSQRDTEYAQAMSILRHELYNRTSLPINNFKFAIVFSKMDLAPGFFYLPDLDNFTTIKFPRLFYEMQKWSQDWNCSIRYFACSAFGMVGNPPKPNAFRENLSNIAQGCGWVLKEPDAWRTFGLVAPVYWLLTGKTDPRLLDYPLF